jgi:hypothetical protein
MSRQLAAFLALSLAVLPCTAQQQPPADKLILPAGTTLSVVLTQQISSSATHAGDQLHLQLVSPVVSGSQLAIPPGTYLQGKVNRITQRDDRVSLSLYAASLAFEDGTVQKLSGPIEVRSAEGWWLPSPYSHRGAILIPFLIAPIAGGAIGAAMGKDGSISGGGFTPTGQIIPPTITPATRGRDAGIGLGVGLAIAAVGVTIYATSHHHGAPDFFFPAGAPMDVILTSAVSLDVAQAPAAPAPAPAGL